MSEFTQPVLGEVLFSVCSHSPKHSRYTEISPKSCPRGLNPLPCRRQSRDSTFWDPATAPLQHLLKGALSFTHHLCPPPSPCLLPSSSDPGGPSPTGPAARMWAHQLHSSLSEGKRDLLLLSWTHFCHMGFSQGPRGAFRE